MPQLSARGAAGASAAAAAGQATMSEEDAVLAALAESLAGDAAARQLPVPPSEGDPDVAARSPPQSGVSFAHITKLGFAATGALCP